MEMTNSDSTAPRHEVDPHNFEAVFNATNPWKDSPSRAAPFNVIDSPRSAPVQPVAESLDVMMSRLATQEQQRLLLQQDAVSTPAQARAASPGLAAPDTEALQQRAPRQGPLPPSSASAPGQADQGFPAPHGLQQRAQPHASTSAPAPAYAALPDLAGQGFPASQRLQQPLLPVQPQALAAAPGLAYDRLPPAQQQPGQPLPTMSQAAPQPVNQGESWADFLILNTQPSAVPLGSPGAPSVPPTYPWELTASLEIAPAKSVKVHHITDFLDEEVSKR